MNQSIAAKLSLDPVHDLQRAFRKLVRALSFPGQLVDLSPEAGRINFTTGLPNGILVIAWMLLDSESSYFCEDNQLGPKLSLLNFSPSKPVESAQFIFSDGQSPDFVGNLAAANGGSLIDPHESATIIARSDFSDQASAYVLSGPGIADKTVCRIGLHPGWLETRNLRNQEFPLGIDLILVDDANRAMALPRSTTIILGGD